MYRVDETGVYNNYADETKPYLAWFPSYYEQLNYIRQGAVASLFVLSLVFVAWGVS